MGKSIADIRIHPISVPLERPFWMSLEPYTVAAEIVVEIETDDGLVGIGEIHGRPQGEIVRILEQAWKPLLLGEDPLDHERLGRAVPPDLQSRRRRLRGCGGAAALRR